MTESPRKFCNIFYETNMPIDPITIHKKIVTAKKPIVNDLNIIFRKALSVDSLTKHYDALLTPSIVMPKVALRV